MGQSIIIFSILMRIAIVIFFVAAVSLISKFVLKLRWLISICIAVLLLTALLIFGSDLIGLRIKVLLHLLLIPAFICAVILIVLFFKWIFTDASSKSSVNPAERSRILKMVEEGKINTDEGKELLDAMGKSSALRGEGKFTRVDIVTLTGVGLVVLGFFLPWIYITFAGRSGHQSGYQTGAIGWTIFIIAIASAIPVFVTPRNLLYKISMLQIFLTIIGAVLVISVLVQAGEHLGAGLVFCLLGFITAFTASIAKLKSLAA